MKEIIIIFCLIAGFVLMFCISKVILMKKSIIYKHVETDKKITNWDYYNNFDGNWFFKEVDYDYLYEITNDVDILIKKKQIKIYKIISASLFFCIIIVMVIGKTIGLFN